jgi:two-component system, sensor histidine kinase FlrB
MNAESLERAFDAFNRQSGRLETSYRELQEKVSTLTGQLAGSQQAEYRQLIEKERLGRRLVRVLDALPGAVIVIDGDGIIHECNSKSTELLRTPLLGCAWSVIVKREFCRGASRDGELKLKNGRWLSLARRPLESEPGEILLLADVTDSHRIAEMLQRNERLSSIGEMTTRLGHQLRTPLASALLHSSRLAETGTQAQQAIAGKISNRLRDLNCIVDDLLRFAIGTTRSGERVMVVDLLNDVAEGISPQLSSAGQLRVEIVDPSLVFVGNRDALGGALLNLVTNSIQACSQQPLIELGAVRSGGDICLTVTDNGPGIKSTILDRIFEPFFTTRPQGTGLGLAVVRSVAESHNGEVLVTSGRRGATFSICIPAPRPADDVTNEDRTRTMSEICHV